MASEDGEPTPDAQRYVDWARPGHFYSPIPDHDEVIRQAERIFNVPDELPGLALRAQEQLELFRELSALARELDLPQMPDPRFRYHAGNLNYGIGDALILGAFLRRSRPRRYLEVGSGWTTALALDVNERWLDSSMRLTAIEPHPELVRSLMRPGDDVEIIATPVQDVHMERFCELDANDVLFIDNSHVVKVGSDAHFLITRVFPVLAPGVIVHVHDIFWPFEYSRVWIDEGRAWNEAYLLHAFLTFNEIFKIAFFNNWFALCHRDVIASELPAMLENPGGALWFWRAK
jgi:hypothetical protein